MILYMKKSFFTHVCNIELLSLCLYNKFNNQTQAGCLWCPDIHQMVNVAEEMAALVYDVDTVVVNVCYQNQTTNVGSNSNRIKCL